MSQHLIVVSIEKGVATLRNRSGGNFAIPSDWLPRRTSEGAAVLTEVSPEEDRSSVSVRLVEGMTEPEGTDIGA